MWRWKPKSSNTQCGALTAATESPQCGSKTHELIDASSCGEIYTNFFGNGWFLGGNRKLRRPTVRAAEYCWVQQRATHGHRQEDLADDAALAEDGELNLALVPGDNISPRQGGELGDAEASGIEDLEEDAVALRPTSTSDMMRLARAAPRLRASDLTLKGA
jgi:hypothetical protein